MQNLHVFLEPACQASIPLTHEHHSAQVLCLKQASASLMYIRRKKTSSAFVWVLQATKEVLLNDYITGFMILLSKYNFQLVTLYQYITNILISFSSTWLLYLLFIACSDSDGVLIFIYCHTVHIQWIWKISYSPLECFSAVLSCKDWLRSYIREQLIIT